MGDVAINVWILPEFAGLIASAAACKSRSTARAKLQTVES